MYLVKSLGFKNAPVSPGKSIAWQVNQIELVDDHAIPLYRNPLEFTILAGPDHADVVAASVALLDEIRLAGAVCVLTGAGAPTDYVAAVAASKVFASAGGNNDLTFTAVAAGAAGNDLAVAIVQDAGLDTPLSVAYLDGTATVTLPTDGAGVPVAATAAEIKTAWDLSDAVDVMTVAFEDTGAGNVSAAAETPLESGADVVPGTGGGYAGGGSLYLRTTGKIYTNKGTAAEPEWGIVTSA